MIFMVLWRRLLIFFYFFYQFCCLLFCYSQESEVYPVAERMKKDFRRDWGMVKNIYMSTYIHILFMSSM